MYHWRDHALCRDSDPELFFPIAKQGSLPYIEQVTAAKAVCQRCPVREECLEAALVNTMQGKDCGVFGGLDEYERSELRRQRALAS